MSGNETINLASITFSEIYFEDPNYIEGNTNGQGINRLFFNIQIDF